jgi:hypothetical protein
MRPGLLPFLVSLLRANPRDELIVPEAASVLKNFAFASDAARSACAKADAAPAIMFVFAPLISQALIHCHFANSNLCAFNDLLFSLHARS